MDEIGVCINCLAEGDYCGGIDDQYLENPDAACCDPDRNAHCSDGYCCASNKIWDDARGECCDPGTRNCFCSGTSCDSTDDYCDTSASPDRCCQDGWSWSVDACAEHTECSPANDIVSEPTCSVSNYKACCNQGYVYGDPEWYEYDCIVVY